MWLSLFLVAFFLATLYFQVIQGLTSAAVMTVCTVISLAIAFGTYEFVAESFLLGMLPDYAHMLALALTFVIPLVILRVVLDIYLPRASLLPQLVDKIGAGVAGFCTAYLITGFMAICIQLVPWGTGFLGYQRFQPETPAKQQELWLQPDRVTARFASAMSSGAFSGSTSFADVHPDLVSEIGWVQSLPRGARRGVPRSSISFVDGGVTTQVYDLIQTQEQRSNNQPPTATLVEPGPRMRFLRTTISVSADTQDKKDNQNRFTPASVRLVGKIGDEPAVYSAIAVLDPDMPSRYLRKWSGERGKEIAAAGAFFDVPANNQVDVAFEVSEGFEPEFVAYKFGARAPFDRSRLKGGERSSPAAGTSSRAAADAAPSPTPSSGGGRVSGVKVTFGKSHFGDALPMELTAYSGSGEIRNGVLEEGVIEGIVAEQGEVTRASSGPVRRFAVPEGKALLHLNVESLKAGSVLGQALNFSVQTLENYILDDDRGNQLTPVGKYAIAKVGDEQIIEVQYNPQIGGRVQPFNRIKNVHLKDDYQLVYLYLLDSGAKAVRFTPGGGKRSTDLSGENLVAP